MFYNIKYPKTKLSNTTNNILYFLYNNRNDTINIINACIDQSTKSANLIVTATSKPTNDTNIICKIFLKMVLCFKLSNIGIEDNNIMNEGVKRL